MIMARTVPLGLFTFLVALVVWMVVEEVKVRDKPAQPAPTYADVTVVDVARGVDAGTLASLVRLRADERVVAVDDQQVENDFAAGALIARRLPNGAARDLASGKYLDLTVTGATGARRVLVLMH
jgi:hypothetical protein